MNERLEEILNDLPGSIRHSGELEELKEHSRSLAERVQELEDVIAQLYDFDGNEQEHSALADMLCGEILHGEALESESE